jgi:hypothetical protein
MRDRDLEGFIVLIVLMLCLGGFAIASTIDNSKQDTIQIQVSNPYNWDVDIELQCDWNAGKNAYEVHQFLLFTGNSIQTIIVPGNTKSCKIWPHVRLWD